MFSEKYFSLKKEVEEAIKDKQPIVALESTIISHGMPYPQNLETAHKIEKTVLENGAVPATIAIVNGKIKIGLDESELEFFSKEKNIIKASRRDISVAVSMGLNAATTVSATMYCAHKAGIKIFATGGIGGVHRGAHRTMDISTDLFELAHTPVAVVSAGIKSILDIGLTLEYLETCGVPVIGYRTSDFPAFFTNKSGLKTNYTMNTADEIAKLINTKLDLQPEGGVLIANPIPETYSLDKQYIDKAIIKSLLEAKEKNIKGKEVTPFLLAEVNKITSGKSLEANIQLVMNNAGLAAQISKFL